MASDPNANTPAGNLQTGARVALLGMGVNIVLATVKIFAGAVGHSYVLIADGIESALDIAGSAVIWGGLKFAARPPDATHPYGHGKAEPVAAIVVSLGVLAAALGIAIQSVREMEDVRSSRSGISNGLGFACSSTIVQGTPGAMLGKSSPTRARANVKSR